MKSGYWIAAAAVSLLAAPRVSARNRLGLPSFYGIAEVRASIPGRIRLYMPAIRSCPENAARMKEKMESTGAVRSVSVHPETGTAVFVFDEKQVEAGVIQGAAIRLMGLDGEIRKQPASKMESGLQTLWESLNHGILEATRGLMDARMLAGTALGIAALRSLMTSGLSLPGGVTLLWWASSLFSRGSHD